MWQFYNKWVKIVNEDIMKLARLYNDMPRFIPTSEKQYIYHYTSPEGLQGIIQESKLRFSDRNFLNDSSEGRYVLDLFINNIDYVCINAKELISDLIQNYDIRKKNLIDEAFHTYQCSFSVNKDNLCLWNYYTKGDNIKGYNLKYDVQTLVESLQPKRIDPEQKVLKSIAGEVIYDERVQLNIIKNTVEAFTDAYNRYEHFRDMIVGWIFDKMLVNGKFFKMPYFRTEEEFRIVFTTMIVPDMISEGIPEDEKFREVNGYFIPYIQKEFNPEALLEITMSPTLDWKLAESSIKRMLNKKFPHVTTLKSEIPVRY